MIFTELLIFLHLLYFEVAFFDAVEEDVEYFCRCIVVFEEQVAFGFGVVGNVAHTIEVSTGNIV